MKQLSLKKICQFKVDPLSVVFSLVSKDWKWFSEVFVRIRKLLNILTKTTTNLTRTIVSQLKNWKAILKALTMLETKT